LFSGAVIIVSYLAGQVSMVAPRYDWIITAVSTVTLQMCAAMSVLFNFPPVGDMMRQLAFDENV